MSILPRLIVYLVLFLNLFFFPSFAFAQGVDCNDPEKPTSLQCIPVFLGNIADKAVILASFAAVIFITYAGIKFITSSGDPIRLASAKKTLIFAILGLLIILFAYFMIKLVAFTTGVECGILGIGDC
jgi:hypothetical protein